VKSIQFILIILCLMATIAGGLVFRFKLGYRLLGALLFATAVSFVLFPDATSTVAHLLGVGRGTDLLVYLGLLAGVYSFLLLYSRTRRLERRMTEQVRAMAIRDAIRLDRGGVQPGSADQQQHAHIPKFATTTAGH
jgi:small membrane protein